MKSNSKEPSANGGEAIRFELAHLVGQLIDHRWMILAVSVLFTLMGTLYSLFATPIYSADAMVQVEQKNANTVLNDLSQMMPNAQPASAAEIEIITSRMVLGKTVADLGLDALVQQDHFPLIGAGLSRIMGKKAQQIAVSRLTVPAFWDKRELSVEVNGPDSYTVSKDDNELFKGKVGQFEQHGDVSMLVSHIDADAGTRFTVSKLSTLQAIKMIGNNLVVADMGKDTGVLGLTYSGEDPLQISRVLDQVINNYLYQNIARKSEEAEKSIQFLAQQLPEVRGKLDQAEDKLNVFRRQHDSVDMSLEAKSALDSSVSIQTQLNELTFREAEVSQLFKKDHPTYRALLEKRQTLENQQKQLNGKISQMPQTQQEIVRLTRDVQAGQEIYMQLLSRQQELNISKASTVGDVRIIDHAETAAKPVAPKNLIIVAASLIVGLMVSVGLVLLKALFHHGIDNPEQLEELGLSVYASVPLSEWQRKKDQEVQLKRKLAAKVDPHHRLLALGNPTDLSIEAIRSLRTSLHFAMMDAENNILMVTGASPGIGKTFICANLATLVAKTGEKVLFIDGDMRRGYTHDLLGAESKTGLSDILSGKLPFSTDLVQRGDYGFDFIARGQVPPNPSELLMHSRMKELVDWASKNYDLVLIDTPPILAVTDASIIGKLAGTSLMVARFETNTVKEVEISYKRFIQNGIEIKGIILNAVVRKSANNYGYGYDYYDYSYKQGEKS
ncbi:polysaccharide biosynthesis tyrosine autokinase [Erwinia pyrifoliae]|uniref:Polysaccharide biosynthesis tyrosine autokinase n=1 Tax=Erwinia pyrifoliae TaxID=79967 RepID=A0ABY5XCU1_ERWPY|nr:polysaccharide biosynthesis tyrosine autokinase [Erwinia pyrifoliae]AUX73100.1 tyrosine-protein kinase [Erwinia pyrifoliae]MCA8876619.1 polysaccharide biosynthesis tyrosine autokinase [Erwinia pyrifoliae]MCT2386734.1 polysaccharide biosynthesis tyrosine autokinase [Erwinia pyrifoliae]MCU8587668.1 polysaccharide biosynthesis tyrosine autokinase [Erwinia pyrifoliae]UWS31466.1 polysaccharide biosynthesis tyrosine autokinase [Erwinia pyrifoliae]